MTAELGMETFAELTPSTDFSATCTALAQLAPHVMPSILRETVSAWDASASALEESNFLFFLQAVRHSARPAIPLRSRDVSFIVLITNGSINNQF